MTGGRHPGLQQFWISWLIPRLQHTTSCLELGTIWASFLGMYYASPPYRLNVPERHQRPAWLQNTRVAGGNLGTALQQIYRSALQEPLSDDLKQLLDRLQ